MVESLCGREEHESLCGREEHESLCGREEHESLCGRKQVFSPKQDGVPSDLAMYRVKIRRELSGDDEENGIVATHSGR
jgi:hypothetical protein